MPGYRDGDPPGYPRPFRSGLEPRGRRRTTSEQRCVDTGETYRQGQDVAAATPEAVVRPVARNHARHAHTTEALSPRGKGL